MHKGSVWPKLNQVRINDKFWNALDKNMADNVLPYQWRVLNDEVPEAEPSHAIENFKITAGEKKGDFYGMVFQDSDVAKWIEAVAYSLMKYPNPDLEQKVDETIDLMERCQQPDGYLNTYFTILRPDARWTYMMMGHELYCAGHLLEAAVAYYSVTGKRKLMDIMEKYVDYIITVMGPEEGKRKIYPGHEEIELALMKAYRLTGKKKYLDLAQFYVEERGKQPCFFFSERDDGPFNASASNPNRWTRADYFQANAPIRELKDADGHAVRAMYYYSGVADLALETGDESLKQALETLWDSAVNRRMYVTGGFGSHHISERFSIDYDLPNDVAYTETCAAVSAVFWSYRMLLMDLDSKYGDVMERSLYNNVLSGQSYDGTKYFYVNPLTVIPEVAKYREDHSSVKTERVAWLECACCPSNLARLVTSLPKYLYSYTEDSIAVHLYVSGDAVFPVGGQDVAFTMESGMPWSGDGKLTITRGGAFKLKLRIPGWCCGKYQVSINGIPVDAAPEKGYLTIDRTFVKGDVVDFSFDMPVLFLRANPQVNEDAGQVAVQRGPLVYCAEEADNGKLLSDLVLKTNETPVVAESDLFGGIQIIIVAATRSDRSEWEPNTLYSPKKLRRVPAQVQMIPYFLWNNRGEGELRVWLREEL